jgi:hypothetical protein
VLQFNVCEIPKRGHFRVAMWLYSYSLQFADLETLNASNHHEQQKIVSEIIVQISLHGHTNCGKS